ncbi:hypothetical protein HDU76_007189, partial [Blyttiomyces sp. JEL0837]
MLDKMDQPPGPMVNGNNIHQSSTCGQTSGSNTKLVNNTPCTLHDNGHRLHVKNNHRPLPKIQLGVMTLSSTCSGSSTSATAAATTTTTKGSNKKTAGTTQNTTTSTTSIVSSGAATPNFITNQDAHVNLNQRKGLISPAGGVTVAKKRLQSEVSSQSESEKLKVLRKDRVYKL